MFIFGGTCWYTERKVLTERKRLKRQKVEEIIMKPSPSEGGAWAVTLKVGPVVLVEAVCGVP